MSASATTGIMIIALPLLVLWGTSIYLRCSDLQIRRYLVAIASLCALLLLEVVIKYTVHSDLATSLLWYSYYIPNILIPLLCFYISLRMTARNKTERVRISKIVTAAVSIALILMVFTNNLHHFVFRFSFADSNWESIYSYGPGYVITYAWIILLYAAFFAMLIRVAHVRLKKLFLPMVIIAVLALAYGLLYVLRVGSLFASNISLTFAILIVLCLELMLRFRLLPSFSNYTEVFKFLPLDATIFSPDLKAAYSTRRSIPLTPEEIDIVQDFARTDQDRAYLHSANNPNNAYVALRQSDSIAVFIEDRSALNASMKQLEQAAETLKAQIALLENSVTVQSELYRLTSEEELLDTIDSHLSTTVSTITKILDALPEDAQERTHALNFVRLLIGYCKRMGSFVLADAQQSRFDREHLELVMSDTAADARASGITCAAFVSTDCTLNRQTLMVLYSCMYDILLIAFNFKQATVMFSLQDHAENTIEFRATIEVGKEKDFAGGEVAEDLCVSLSAYGMPYRLTSDENEFFAIVHLPRSGGDAQ